MPQKCAYDTLYESRCRCAASKQARTLRPGRATCPSTLAETVTSVAANKDTKDVWVGGLLSGWSIVCFQASMWESPCLQANRAGSSSSWTTQDDTGRGFVLATVFGLIAQLAVVLRQRWLCALVPWTHIRHQDSHTQLLSPVRPLKSV